ncbi:hypothetical protein NMG60_11019667 [Bertholletia excelsa]
MEVEVMPPSPGIDFNFDSTTSTPFISAPSSPQWFFPSAPASPSRSSAARCGSMEAGVDDKDFEFDFSGQLDRALVSAADELFSGGKIKPLEPPTRSQFKEHAAGVPPNSPIATKIFKRALSPRQRGRGGACDSSTSSQRAIEQSRGGSNENQRRERGRERSYDSSTSNSRHKGTRSLSPFRIGDIFSEMENTQQSSDLSTSTKPKNSSRWSLKNLLLFRSASEGRAENKDPLKKYSLLSKSSEENVRSWSFRSTDSASSTSRRRRQQQQASAHELHYAAGRAVAEQMRKTTLLPYKHGLLGCMGFDHAVHESSRGFSSLTR